MLHTKHTLSLLHHLHLQFFSVTDSVNQCNRAVLEIGMVMGGSLSSCRGRRKEYSSLLGTVATMILLKSTFSSFLGYSTSYLTTCPYALNYLICTATLTHHS